MLFYEITGLSPIAGSRRLVGKGMSDGNESGGHLGHGNQSPPIQAISRPTITAATAPKMNTKIFAPSFDSRSCLRGTTLWLVLMLLILCLSEAVAITAGG